MTASNYNSKQGEFYLCFWLGRQVGRTFGFAEQNRAYCVQNLKNSVCGKEECVAIFSLNIKSVGRSTHCAGTAAAHVSYISRGGAGAKIGAQHMPDNPDKAQAWLLEQEQNDRKNARVVDKIILALPRELTSEQRYELAREYAKEITQGRAAYYFAIHEEGKDANNPHCHMVIRDRDFETGQKIIGLSDSKKQWEVRGRGEESPSKWVRERWEHHANKALENAGYHERIDRRTLEAQRDEALKHGDIKRAQELDRKAQIHIGVKAQRLAAKGIRPESKGNYQKVDQGRTRGEYNAEIIDLHIEKKIRSRDHTIRTWGLFEKEQAAKDRALEKQNIQTRNRLEAQEKEIRAYYRVQLKRLGQDRNQYAETQVKRTDQERKQALQQLQLQQKQEIEKLRVEQGRLFARITAFLDFTGKTAEKRKKAIHHQEEQHQAQIKEHQKATDVKLNETRETAMVKYKGQITELLDRRDHALQRQDQNQKQVEHLIQSQLQQRAIDREHARKAVEHVIKDREKSEKAISRVREQDNQPKQGATKMQKPAHELSHMISDKQNDGRTSLEKWQDRGMSKIAENHGQEAQARGVSVSQITAEHAHNARYSDKHLQPTPEPQACQATNRAAEIKAEIEAARSGQGQQQSQDKGMEVG